MSVTNCNCKEQKCNEYCDCKGNTFCICTDVEKPYVQEHELLAPIFKSTTWGSESYYRGKIEKDVYKKKGKAFVHIKRPLKVGDIVVLSDFCNYKYFLKSKNRRKDFYNNFIFEIERMDGDSITYLDLNRLKKGKTLLVKGYVVDKK